MSPTHFTAFALAAALTLGATAAEAGNYRILHKFTGGTTDGATPAADVIQVGSTLYGTTATGGANAGGTLFAINLKTNATTIVHSFGATGDGKTPQSALVAVNGTLYGTTAAGGAAGCGKAGCGTIFAFNTASGTETVVHNFGKGDGTVPMAGLVAFNNVLYGTTSQGGGKGCAPYGCGTVYSFDPASGTETVVTAFKGALDAANPEAPLTVVGSSLYGTSFAGGGSTNCSYAQNGCGTVFSVNPATGQETVVHAFGGSADGANPVSALTSFNNLLYGTTPNGGDLNNAGVLYSLDPSSGAEATVWVFGGADDGIMPTSEVTPLGGLLYGTTLYGGSKLNGVVFSFDPVALKETILQSYGGGAGGRPLSGLFNSSQALYGTTSIGGGSKGCKGGCGTVFKLVP